MRANRSSIGYSLLAVMIVSCAASVAAADNKSDGAWGTVKGQVVLAGDKVPQPAPLKVNKDEKDCLKNGPITSQELVVNPQNKGVRWAMVWLVPDDGKGKADLKGKMPVHPSLKEPKQKEVVIDQPCCMFEPRIVMLREGQTLVIKNSAAIPHNAKIDGELSGNPSLNQSIPPGKQLDVTGFHPTTASAIPLACTSHGWMSGYLRVFNHPYFAVTDADGKFEIKDAPAGKFHLIVWQEKVGWVAGDTEPSKNGKLIEIKPGETTDLGKIELKDK